MSRDPDPRVGILVISGMQGAGKSTVARLLAERFARGAWISADALQKMIVAGGEWPVGREPAGEDLAQLRLRLRNACLLAESFVAAGFAAVIDDIVIGSRVDDLLQDLAGRELHFVMLTPRLEVVKQRERGRGTQLWKTAAWMDEEIRQRTRRIGLWLDSSEQTAEQTTDEILARVFTEGRVERMLRR